MGAAEAVVITPIGRESMGYFLKTVLARMHASVTSHASSSKASPIRNLVGRSFASRRILSFATVPFFSNPTSFSMIATLSPSVPALQRILVQQRCLTDWNGENRANAYWVIAHPGDVVR